MNSELTTCCGCSWGEVDYRDIQELQEKKKKHEEIKKNNMLVHLIECNCVHNISSCCLVCFTKSIFNPMKEDIHTQ